MNKVLLSNKFMSRQVNELLVHLLTYALKNSSQKRSYVTLYFNVCSTNSEQCKLCVNGSLYIDARLLWKQAIAAIAPNKLTMKLSKHLCMECSTCAMFFSSSFTISIMALFLSKSLSETLINAPFMLLFNLVISCIPSAESL